MTSQAVVLAAFLLLAATALIAESARIAVYNPHFAHSHTAYHAKLADVLQDAGHNVTVIYPELSDTHRTYTKKASVLVGEIDHSTHTWQRDDTDFWSQMQLLQFMATRESVQRLRKNLNILCERVLTNKGFLEILRAQEFEFAMFEPLDNCAFAVFDKIGVKQYAFASPILLTEFLARANGAHSRLPWSETMSVYYHGELPLFLRTINYLDPYLRWAFDSGYSGFSVPAIQKYHDPNFDEFQARGSARVVFVNTEEHIDLPRPLPPKIVYIGGITIDSDSHHRHLDKKYQEIFNRPSDGVVLISFGSLAKSSRMPKNVLASFLAMFEAFPNIEFVWKYEEIDDVASNLTNVHKSKWVPQKQILAHPRLLAFVTHSGMNSILEGVHAGVPLVTIPLFADQPRNALMAQKRRTSVLILKHTLSPTTLIDAVKKVAQGESGAQYRHRAKTIASMIASKPLSARERFLRHIDFAVKFKDEEDVLDIQSKKYGFLRYYELDIIAALVGFFAVVGLVLAGVIYGIVKVALLVARVLQGLVPKSKSKDE